MSKDTARHDAPRDHPMVLAVASLVGPASIAALGGYEGACQVCDRREALVDRAAEMRALSELMTHDETRVIMLKLADDYDKLADRAQKRADRADDIGGSKQA
jgi:hypothetical protein